MKKQLLVAAVILFTAFSSFAQLSNINPNTGALGQTLTTTITGTGIFINAGSPSGNLYQIYLQQGVDIISLFDYWNMWMYPNVTVTSPNTVDAELAIPITSTPGTYDLHVTVGDISDPATNQINYSLPGAFTIPLDGYIEGTMYNDLNENGIKDIGEPGMGGRYVKLMPTNYTLTTDANGDFSFPVANGTYDVIFVNSVGDYLFVTTSDTISVTISSNNSLGNDFGLKNALFSVTPDHGFPGLVNGLTLVSSEPIFIVGPNPYGNVTVFRVYTTPMINVNPFTSVIVLDPYTIQANVSIPGNVTLADSIDISVGISGLGTHYLRQKFTVELPPDLVSGRLFFDIDQDKVNDPGEPGIINGKVKLVPDNSYAFSDFNGDFVVGSFGGVQTLTYENNIPGLVLFTDSTSYTFNATGSVTGKDFGFLSIYPDYDISVTAPYIFRRCNSNQTGSFKVTNISNVTYNAEVWMYHSPNMTYISSPVPPSNISNDTIYWNVTNLTPLAYENIEATFLLPGAGQIIDLTAGASSLDAGGVVQLTDAASSSFVIACSLDPNDKAVTPPGIFAENFTLMSDTLEYLIRFQNTGNDTALNVVVLDTLDSDLDYNTFEVLGSSHSLQTELQSNGAIRFAFDDIMLPDSNVNEPESHGYVRYRIVANQGLLDSTEVVNTAHIFFDFNPDVITNTTLNTLVFVLPVGIGEISPDEKVLLYPNPFSHSATLLFENQSAEKYTLTLTAITGNKIADDQSTHGNSFVIEKGKLPKGIYFYNLKNTVNNKTYSGKFIVD